MPLEDGLSSILVILLYFNTYTGIDSPDSVVSFLYDELVFLDLCDLLVLAWIDLISSYCACMLFLLFWDVTPWRYLSVNMDSRRGSTSSSVFANRS